MALLGPWPDLLSHPRLEIDSTVAREAFEQSVVRVELSAGSLHPALLLKPTGSGPFPAVIVPFYDPQTSAGLAGLPHRDLGYQLVRRGLVVLCLGAPGGDARRPDLAGATTQPLSYLAYLAANALTALAQQPAVRPERIGIAGHSYGGKWALFASCLDDRFVGAAWSDPGIVFTETRRSVNYWEPWYLGRESGKERLPGLISSENPRTGSYRVLVEQGRDLHELHALMAPRPFLVSGGAEDGVDRWSVLRHAVEVNHVLGFEGRVGLHNRPLHDPTEESNRLIGEFFEHLLKR